MRKKAVPTHWNEYKIIVESSKYVRYGDSDMGWTFGESWSHAWQEQDILFFTASVPPLRPTHNP
jgi:hypothetical protein